MIDDRKELHDESEIKVQSLLIMWSLDHIYLEKLFGCSEWTLKTVNDLCKRFRTRRVPKKRGASSDNLNCLTLRLYIKVGMETMSFSNFEGKKIRKLFNMQS